MNNNRHLTLDSRVTIETQLNERNTFKGIALLLGKDCRHAFFHQCSSKNTCSSCFSPNRVCWSCGKCISSCILYEKYICPKLEKTPYVCNGCPERSKCSLEKRLYKAAAAQKEYELVRSESRSGFALSEQDLKHLDGIVSPLLKKGQSLHHISIHHADELMKSERTLYTYINNGLFTARNIDMPRTVRMRPRKSATQSIKVDKSCRIVRDMECFRKFKEENPFLPVRQMDSVEGVKGGAVLLTIHFVEQELQLAFYVPTMIPSQ